MNRNICPDCGAFLDPGEVCDCDGEEFTDTRIRDRLRAIQAAEQRNQQHIGEFISQQKQKNMIEYLFK